MCLALARLQLGILTLFYSIAQALSLLSGKEAPLGIVVLKEFCPGCWIGFDTRYIALQSKVKDVLSTFTTAKNRIVFTTNLFSVNFLTIISPYPIEKGDKVFGPTSAGFGAHAEYVCLSI